jgi:RNA polymerase sigma factor (sigma-70 family)
MASVRLSLSQRHLETLFREGSIGTLTDSELLQRFASRRGEAAEAAFAVLVERHAPMVLATCRRLLCDVHDAEDAAQAAFLVLARKARTIRSGQAIGGWLHSVAVRIASKAKVAAARRRKHERRSAEVADRCEDPSQPADRWTEVHNQIERLPDRLRLPIVLCYLEGMTHGEAAQQLGWPVGTVESRLARGRERLKERLTGRGASPMVALPGSSALPEMTLPAAPRAWIEVTARAATRFAAGEAPATVASANVAAMAREMIWSMGLHLTILTAGCVLAAVIVAAGAAVALRGDPARNPLPVQQESVKAVAPAPENPAEPVPPAPVTIKRGGRVLDPDGRPLAGAKLWLAFQGTDWTWSTRVPQVRTATGADGRFDLSVSDDDPEVKRALRMTSGWPHGFGAIQLVATADGYGPAWTDLAESKGDVDLRLVRDDVPVEGRLVTLEGRPLAGIEVRTLRVEAPSHPMDLYGAPSGFLHSSRTDGDGRFRLTGIGRDRRAILGMLGPGIERSNVYVVTGSYPEDRSPQKRGMSLYPARFEHPCKPGQSIAGVVRDRDTRAPLAGVAVRSIFYVSAQTATDREGRFRLDGLSKQPSYTLNASASASDQPYITTERSVADGPGDAPVAADIEMVRGVVVTGRLIDRANGRPVQAWVGYTALKDNPHWSRLPGWIPTIGNRYSPSPGWHVPSMADGSYRIVVPPGRGFLVAHIQYQSDRYIPAGIPSKRHPGAPADALDMHYDTVPFELFTSNFPAVCPVDIAPETESATYDLTFDSGTVLTGTVLDPDGKPLPGASMVGESYAFSNLFTFKPLDGARFTAYGLSSSPLLPRTLIFRHAGRHLGKTLRVDVKEKGPLEVRLEPTASARGRLLDGSGLPRDGVELRVMRLIKEPTRGAHLDFSPPIGATTDQDGRFQIDGVVPGAVQKIRAIGLKGGSEVFILEDWTPKPGEVKDLGEIRR